MASGIRVEGEPSDRKKCLWRINTWWWDLADLGKEVDLVEVPSCPGYQDFEAIISREKAQALAARFRDHAGRFEKSAQRLDAALAQAECASVIITLFEWEIAPPSDFIPGVTDREAIEQMKERQNKWNATRPPPAEQRWKCNSPPIVRMVEVERCLFQMDRYYLTELDTGPYYEVFQDGVLESVSYHNPRQPAQDHMIIQDYQTSTNEVIRAAITADILLSGCADPPVTFARVRAR